MPRRPSQSPKYRHYRPKDLAVVRIDGHDHYLGKHGSPESWERYHRLLAERATARGACPPPETAPAVERPDRLRADPGVLGVCPGALPPPRRDPLRGARQPQGRPAARPQALRPDPGERLRPPGPAVGPPGDDPVGPGAVLGQRPGQPDPPGLPLGGLARAGPGLGRRRVGDRGRPAEGPDRRPGRPHRSGRSRSTGSRRPCRTCPGRWPAWSGSSS